MSLLDRLVHQTFAYDGGRQVAVYVPADPPDSVLYCGDGQATEAWGQALEVAGLSSTLVVGVHAPTSEQARLEEYSPSFNPSRFAAHEQLMIGPVRDWVSERFAALPADRTAVFGASAGGELALALGSRHPELYGAILCASPGAGFGPAADLPVEFPRTYLVAGDEEPFFLDNAARWAQALKESGVEVVFKQRNGGHGGAFWAQELALMVRWAFPSA